MPRKEHNAGFSSEALRQRITERENQLRQPGAMMFSRSRYEIERVLGEGGMGITCLANEVSAANLKRPVVLKFVKDSLDATRLDRFLNEVQLSVLFNHPNLVPVFRLENETIQVETGTDKHDYGRTYEHTVYYAVMQYIDGWNLRQLVSRCRELNIKLNPDITMFIINKVARGLHYVHEYKGEDDEHVELVHRDVSPENILIDRFGRIKVADFGLTKRSTGVKGDAVTNMGKMLYSSPEQRDGLSIDRRADIYNIGLVLYFMFTDNDRFGPEWGLENMRERIRTKMKKSVLDDLKKDIEPRLAHICEMCLAEDPDARYQTCEDLATDIDIYFKESQKVVTNELLSEVLNELFKEDPTFTSRRFVPLTGSEHLPQPGYDPSSVQEPQKVEQPLSTVPMDEEEDGTE